MLINKYRFTFSLLFLVSRLLVIFFLMFSVYEGYFQQEDVGVVISLILLPLLISNISNIFDSIMTKRPGSFSNSDTEITKTFAIISLGLLTVWTITIIYITVKSTYGEESKYGLLIAIGSVESAFSMLLSPILKRTYQRKGDD